MEKIEKKLNERNKKKGKPKASTHHRDLRCFKRNGVKHMDLQCINKKSMVILGNDKHATTSENESDSDMPTLKDADGKEYLAEGKEFVMVFRQALSAQVVED